MSSSTTRDRSSEEMFLCSICLEVFEEPVTTSPCGHNLCRRCISQAWDTDESCCTCPLCNEVFHSSRPELKVNTLLKKETASGRTCRRTRAAAAALWMTDR
ncbi:hypothetical protein NL108_018373 [Boleophthalmus pectinirostris]|nr:hypothetical protein NL108_018373 [Boleophthalmus pectinirostris]